MTGLSVAPEKQPVVECSWALKHRPRRLEDVALDPADRELLERLGESGILQDMLLVGPSGTDKTALAEAAALDGEVLRVNAASELTIHTRRGEVREFLRTRSLRGHQLKVVIVDEVSALTPDEQRAVATFMEEFGARSLVILTSREPSTIDPAVRSRCGVVIDLGAVPDSEKRRVLERVLEVEQLVAQPGAVDWYLNAFLNVRSMLLAAQRSAVLHGDLRPLLGGQGVSEPLAKLVARGASEEVRWVVEPIIAHGRATVLAGPPKEAGKTTYSAYLATAKARGGTFLGQKLEPEPVLYVSPDEHVGDVCHRFEQLGAPRSEIHIVTGAPDIADIVAEANRLQVGLVIIDTLSRVAQISNENDNARTTRWWDRALQVIRRSQAAFVLVHHHRKSGGRAAEAVRGASAIVASADIIISLSRVTTSPRQRRLSVDGTRYEWPPDQIIELRDGEYICVGPASVDEQEELANERCEVILELLAEGPLTTPELKKALSDRPDTPAVPDTAVDTILVQLEVEGLVESRHLPKRGSPKLWSLVDDSG